MAAEYILSVNADSERDVELERIADRIQAVYRRCAAPEQACNGSVRETTSCVVFEDRSGDGSLSERFCDLLEQQEVRRASVMIMHHSRLETAARAVRCGAVAVHPPSVDEPSLEASVREALAISAQYREADRRTRGVSKQLDRLSEGELWVLRLVLDGHLNKRIASKLDISERTVEARRKRIFEKTQTESVAQLVREIVETVGMNEILIRCGEPVKQPPAPHWDWIHRSTASGPARNSGSSGNDPRRTDGDPQQN